jgi:hypothetical protein
MYANGDGTDSWCRSDVRVLEKLYNGGKYVAPACNVETCLLADFTAPPTLISVITAGAMCDPSYKKGFIFICEYP